MSKHVIRNVEARTVFIAQLPMTNLPQAGRAPEPVRFLPRVLQTLLDLDALVWLDQLTQNACGANRRVKSLVTTALCIVHILADNPPVLKLERLLTEDVVCVDETVEDESASRVKIKLCFSNGGINRTAYWCVTSSRSVQGVKLELAAFTSQDRNKI